MHSIPQSAPPAQPETLYKFLAEDGSANHGGHGRWHLPQGDEPGAWMPEIVGPLVPCHNGYHLVAADHLIDWAGPALFVAEYDGERVDDGDKVVVRRARLLRRVDRWNLRTMRLWACDVAEHVLHIAERNMPDDTRARDAIAVARRHIDGLATNEELAAATDATTAATATATAAATAADAAAYAAAAYAAAYAAADDDAKARERTWQRARLMEYLSGTVTPMESQVSA